MSSAVFSWHRHRACTKKRARKAPSSFKLTPPSLLFASPLSTSAYSIHPLHHPHLPLLHPIPHRHILPSSTASKSSLFHLLRLDQCRRPQDPRKSTQDHPERLLSRQGLREKLRRRCRRVSPTYPPLSSPSAFVISLSFPSRRVSDLFLIFFLLPPSLPSALAASFSSSDAARGNSFPWEQLSGWIRSWLIKVEGVWNELEDGVGGETGDASTTTTMNQDLLSPRNPSPSKQPFAPVKSQSKPLSTSAAVLPPPPPSKASPSPTSTGPAKRPSTTATALIPPPRKKARKSKLGGRTTRNMFGEDSSEEDSEEE